jgi:hypothetical protein
VHPARHTHLNQNSVALYGKRKRTIQNRWVSRFEWGVSLDASLWLAVSKYSPQQASSDTRAKRGLGAELRTGTLQLLLFIGLMVLLGGMY